MHSFFIGSKEWTRPFVMSCTKPEADYTSSEGLFGTTHHKMQPFHVSVPDRTFSETAFRIKDQLNMRGICGSAQVSQCTAIRNEVRQEISNETKQGGVNTQVHGGELLPMVGGDEEIMLVIMIRDKHSGRRICFGDALILVKLSVFHEFAPSCDNWWRCATIVIRLKS